MWWNTEHHIEKPKHKADGTVAKLGQPTVAQMFKVLTAYGNVTLRRLIEAANQLQ